jgi:hypothetical protein
MGIEVLSRGLRGRVVNLTTGLHLLPRLRMNGVISLLPYTPSWSGKKNLTWAKCSVHTLRQVV